MTRPMFRNRWLAAASLAAMASLGACTTPGGRAPAIANSAVLALGDNRLGDPCQAVRARQDAALNSPFDQSFSITCRGSAANQSFGQLRSLVASDAAMAKLDATLDCRSDGRSMLPGLGDARVRRCFDRTINGEVVVADIRSGDRVFVGTAAPLAAGPMVAGLRLLSGKGGIDGEDAAPAFAALAPLPADALGGNAASTFDPSIALRQGVAFNRRGLHSDASRVLNDALGRLGTEAPAGVRAELQLEAALADSNIRFFDSATGHFEAADALLGEPGIANQAFLSRKRDIYRALDLLNRREFGAAESALGMIGSASGSVMDPLNNVAIIQLLNQAGGQGLSQAVNTPDEEQTAQLLLQAQANWARSIAFLGAGDARNAAAALATADAAFAPLRTARIDQGPLYWLDARIRRQQARVYAAQGNWTAALQQFDAASDLLTRSAVSGAGSGSEPGIADIRLERAAVLLRSGASADAVSGEYRTAITGALAAGAANAGAPAGIERYLDQLAADDRPERAAQNAEDFFLALQAIGEPAVARQINSLRSQLDADPALGARLRDRADLQREATRLSFEIADAGRANPAAVPMIEARRESVLRRLREVEGELATNSRVASVEERPVTVEDVRSALRPGEVYFKVAEVNGHVYGMLINQERSYIYRAIGSARVLADLAREVRGSIDGNLRTTGRIVQFKVAESYELFRRLTGPATDALLAADAIVVEPSGPLERLPLGVLVTDSRSISALRSRRSQRDFSAVAFLAREATISNSVSPRSFITARSLPETRARQAFIGFAAPAEPVASAQGRMVNLGPDCNLPFSDVHALWEMLGPINPEEVTVAAQALQPAGSTLVTGADFSDTAVESRSDLSDFRVLHFATHGFEEGQWGCANSPPALLTSLADADSNGVLSFGEIARLRLDANLVFLSACDTGSGVQDESVARLSGQEEVGSTLEGLVRSFLTANARSVIATHWPVSAEEEGLDFIDTFYRTARQDSIAASLRAAQTRLIDTRDFSHPYYWAAYFVVGDGSKNLLSGSMAAAPPAGGQGAAAR